MDAEEARERLVRALAARHAITDPRVEAALRAIPRHVFLPAAAPADAYADAALPIGRGQTISAPHIVAAMAQALDVRAGHRVLEVGAGSGYHAAILAHLSTPGGRVITIERDAILAHAARAAIAEAADRIPLVPVDVRQGDGSLGAPDAAPFDRVSMAAGAPSVPPPLLEQLALDGSLVAPIGPAHDPWLIRVQRTPQGTTQDALLPVRFVPLVGEHGWPE